MATEEFEEWMMGLTEKQRVATSRAINQLRIEGPTLGRPLVDTIRQSRFKYMKELRISSDGATGIPARFDEPTTYLKHI